MKTTQTYLSKKKVNLKLSQPVLVSPLYCEMVKIAYNFHQDFKEEIKITFGKIYILL